MAPKAVLSFGHFDGQFHTISNLSINRPGAENQGLFGFVGAGAVVENVRLTDVNVTGGGHTGSLIGVALGASIHTCGASGLLFIRPNGSSDAKSGGLIGSASRGTDVIYCFSAVRVDAGSRLQVGGLIGYLRGVGYPTRLFDSYSSGEVIGNGSKQGNLLGDADGSEVDRCYSSGRFKALIGYNFRDPVITRSYWDSDTGATSSIYGGTPKTTEEMMLQSTYQDWNFATIWEIIDTVTYPGFQSTVPVELMGFTVGDRYQIGTTYHVVTFPVRNQEIVTAVFDPYSESAGLGTAAVPAPIGASDAPPQFVRRIAGGGSGIRTHGGLHLTGFQDQRLRPLGHPSGRVVVQMVILLESGRRS